MYANVRMCVRGHVRIDCYPSRASTFFRDIFTPPWNPLSFSGLTSYQNRLCIRMPWRVQGHRSSMRTRRGGRPRTRCENHFVWTPTSDCRGIDGIQAQKRWERETSRATRTPIEDRVDKNGSDRVGGESKLQARISWIQIVLEDFKIVTSCIKIIIIIIIEIKIIIWKNYETNSEIPTYISRDFLFNVVSC